MAFVLKEGQGSLFRNEKRVEGSNQPNARGDALIGGVLYEISAWTKEGAKGKYQSLNIKPKEARPAGKPHTAAGDGFPEGSDDLNIPF